MYTNEILEEKYKAQRILSEESRMHKKDYFLIVEKEVGELCKRLGWKLKFSNRKGGWINPPQSRIR